MSQPTEAEESGSAPDERADRNGWLELFFDLVAVAAIAILTEGLLAHPTFGSLAMLALMFGALWLSWVLVMLYSNVAGAQTRARTIVLAMVLIALMAGSVPAHHPERANAFAIAFVLLRGLIGANSARTGRLLTSWPLYQVGGVILPWIVSLWVDSPAKFFLWALGLLVDLVPVVLRGGFTEEQLSRMNARLAQQQIRLRERELQGRRWGPGGRREDRMPDQLVGVDVDREHLDDRLGTFVIIVLGEAVSQIVLAAAQQDWTGSFLLVAGAGFLLLIGLWWLTFSFGATGAPRSAYVELPPRFGLPLHLLSTLGLVGFAAGLGELAGGAGHQELPLVVRWALCGGLALHFAVGVVSGALGHAGLRWVLAWGAGSIAYLVVLGLVGGYIDVVVLPWLALVPVGWQVGYGVAARRQSAVAG